MKAKSKKPCYAAKGLPKVPGKPKGTDIIPAWLTPGEAVLSPGAAEMLGRGNVQALNKAASTMRLGTPQYKAEGEDEMVQGMDSATLGNQRADEILSDPGMYDSREVRAAERYMDPAGLAGGPSPTRDGALLGGISGISAVQQLAQAQQGLYGDNQPRRLGNIEDDSISEGMSAAQEAVGSALSYGRQAAQDAIEQGQRARYMAQGGIVPSLNTVQPGYYGMGTSMVLGNRPMYMAGGGLLNDDRLRQGRDPGVAQAMQSFPVQKPVAPVQTPSPVLQKAADMAARPGPMSSVNQGIDAAKSAWQNTAPQYGTGAGAAMALREGVGTFRQAAGERLQNRLQPAGNAMQEASNFVSTLVGGNPAAQVATQAPGRVGTGFNPAAATTGLANRGSFGGDIVAATGKNPAGRTLTGMETLSRNGDVKPTSEPMTARQGANGNINLNWINQQAKDMASRLGTQANNQPTPIQQNAQNAVYMGGLKMPWNQGDFVSYKDSAGILRAGRAGPSGFENPMMNLPSMTQDAGMRSAIEAQNSMYTANKSLADANDSNAQAAIRPMQGLNYLGNVMRDTAMTRTQDSQADLNEAILKNPELFSGRLGSKGIPAGAEATLKPQSLNMSDGNIMQFGNQFYRMDPQTNALVNVDMPLSPEDQRLVDQARKLRPDLANIPASTLLETLRNQQNSQTQNPR